MSGNADRDTLSQIEKLLNEGDNAKNIWTHAWICMHDSDNEIVNSQANRTKANQYSLWHEVYETTGYDARNATYKNGTFIVDRQVCPACDSEIYRIKGRHHNDTGQQITHF